MGCFNCFNKGEESCPHYSDVHPIIKAIEEADAVIFSSPVYVLEVTGQMKCFFDHMAYRYYAHRPHPAMFKKIGVVVSTTGGVGHKGVAKSMQRQFFWWGGAKSYLLAFRLAATCWDDITEKKRQKILKAVGKTARKIIKTSGKVKHGIKSRFIFSIMKTVQNKYNWCQLDKEHWKKQGWIK